MEVIGEGVQVDQIADDDQRHMADKPHMEILGIRADSRGSTQVVVAGRELVAMAVWVHNHCWFCCKRVDRRELVHASAGVAFLYGTGRWTQSAHVWQSGSVVEAGLLGAMMHCKGARVQPWHEWAPASTRAARG